MPVIEPSLERNGACAKWSSKSKITLTGFTSYSFEENLPWSSEGTSTQIASLSDRRWTKFSPFWIACDSLRNGKAASRLSTALDVPANILWNARKKQTGNSAAPLNRLTLTSRTTIGLGFRARFARDIIATGSCSTRSSRFGRNGDE